MSTEHMIYTAGIVVVGLVLFNMTLPKNARAFAHGPDGETALAWDPTSKPKKA